MDYPRGTALRASGMNCAENEPIPNSEEVATAKAFLEQCLYAKTCQARTVDSYRLKHVIERWGEHVGMSSYVSNGAVILAALEMGIVVRSIGKNSPNAYIGIGNRCIRSFSDLLRKR